MHKNLLAILLFTTAFCFGQNSIKGTFTPAEDYKFAILYKVTPTTSMYTANSEISDDGSFEFQLDSTATKGMYRIVYAVPQDEYNFDLIYDGKESVDLEFNQETGAIFKASTENKLYNSYLNSMALISNTIGNFYQQESTDKKALEDIFKTQRETQLEFENASKGMIANNFVKASAPYIPDGFVEVETYIANLKTHYFDVTDFNNKTLQSSNFLIEQVLNYVFGMVAEEEDAIKAYMANIDAVAKAMKMSDTSIQKTLLEIVWMQMADANYEVAANYVASKYLLELAKEMKDEALISAITTYKNTSLGATAADFPIEIIEGEKPITKTLLDLDNAERYVIFFWSSVCSHCLEEIPQLSEFIEKQNKGDLQVVAIGLEDEPYRWKDMTYDYPDFIHVYGEGKWDNEIGNNYNVTATPSYFVLDKNKRIISKPEDIVALKQYLKDNPLEKKVEEKKEEDKKGN